MEWTYIERSISLQRFFLSIDHLQRSVPFDHEESVVLERVIHHHLFPLHFAHVVESVEDWSVLWKLSMNHLEIDLQEDFSCFHHVYSQWESLLENEQCLSTEPWKHWPALMLNVRETMRDDSAAIDGSLVWSNRNEMEQCKRFQNLLHWPFVSMQWLNAVASIIVLLYLYRHWLVSWFRTSMWPVEISAFLRAFYSTELLVLLIQLPIP